MRNTLLLFSAFLAIFALASCGKKTPASKNPAANQALCSYEEALVQLLDGDFTLVVGLDASFPPYGFRDEATGELVGFDLDLAKEVARRRGWKIKLLAIDWDAKDAELNSGSINCIWNGFTINGREEYYTWSEPYVDSSQVILVRKDSPIQTKADLAGTIVEAQADSSGLKALQSDECAELRNSLKTILEVPTFNQAYMELQAGACDAVVIDYSVAVRLMKGNDVARMLDENLTTEQYGIGFKLGNTAIRDLVQETLDEMHQDGTFTSISRKWFDGEDVTIQKK
ncbi:MAG: transporter substrate-binding domain-containing protein [Oligosphaeraceae bacterium]